MTQIQRWRLHPRLAQDTHPVATLPLCELRLMDDANYPWLVLVPRTPGAVDILDLDPAARHRLSDEIDHTARALRDICHLHKLNIAALGNQVPQLHVHVIGRRQDDPAWPRPVWGHAPARPYPPERLLAQVARLRRALQPLASALASP